MKAMITCLYIAARAHLTRINWLFVVNKTFSGGTAIGCMLFGASLWPQTFDRTLFRTWSIPGIIVGAGLHLLLTFAIDTD